MADQAPKDLIGFLDFYLVKKAPFQLPDGAKEAIVKYGPWIVLVLMVLSLPVLLMALGLSAALLPFAVAAGAGGGFGLSVLLVLVQIVLEIASLPGLFARKMSGWRLMFYATLVGIVSSLASLAVLSAIVFGVIGLYILFQVRPLYSESGASARSNPARV